MQETPEECKGIVTSVCETMLHFHGRLDMRLNINDCIAPVDAACIPEWENNLQEEHRKNMHVNM